MCGAGIAYGAMRCAVLSWRMVLCDVRCWHSVWCYAVCGTGIAYGAMRCAVLALRMLLSSYALARRCPVLSYMPTTDTAYGAMRCARGGIEPCVYAIREDGCGTELAYGASRVVTCEQGLNYSQAKVRGGIKSFPPANCTEKEYDSRSDVRYLDSGCCYAMCGAKNAFLLPAYARAAPCAVLKCAVLSWRMVLCDV
eukprot:683128-Rhodomonas_salina.1